MAGTQANRGAQDLSLSIGDLSERTDVKIPTIRYYEQIGLLATAKVSQGRHRRYDEDDVRRLLFVKKARELGFEVDAVRELLALDGGMSPEGSAAASRFLGEIESRMKALKALRSCLRAMLSAPEAQSLGIVKAIADVVTSQTAKDEG